jgi:hypothetical protein
LILLLRVRPLLPAVNPCRTLNCLPLTLFLHGAADDGRHQLLTRLSHLLGPSHYLLGNVDKAASDFQQNIILQEALQVSCFVDCHL